MARVEGEGRRAGRAPAARRAGAGRGAALREAERAQASLDRLRRRVDGLDAALLEILSERYGVIAEIQRVKQRSGDGVYVPGRERAQIERLEALNRRAARPIRPEALRAIFGEILSASRALQGRLTIAYLGPPGTFSETAARAHFGSGAELVPVGSIPEVFQAVERERVRLGIVPIENTLGGMVVPTLDALVTTPLRIVAERELPIRHALLARAPGLKAVRRVVSHAQSLVQCRDWLVRHLPNARLTEVASNAAAAERAARSRGTAAIAPRDAAARYGLRVLAEDVQDMASNVTRFVVIAGTGRGAERGADKVSVLFSVRNEAGRLFRALKPLARGGIDLVKLESRPMRGRPWEYLFFVDFRGDVASRPVRTAIAAMKRECIWFKELGTYPEARGA